MEKMALPIFRNTKKKYFQFNSYAQSLNKLENLFCIHRSDHLRPSAVRHNNLAGHLEPRGWMHRRLNTWRLNDYSQMLDCCVFFFFLKGLNTDELKVDGSSTGFYAAMG